MTDPHDKNDDWADLLQELGVEGAEQPSKVVAVRVPEPKAEPVVHDEGFAPVDSDEPFGFEPGDEASESTEDESAEGDADGDSADGDSEDEEGDDEPGGEGSDESSPDDPNKKKRRRRRRRRKKGAPGTPEAGEAVVGAAPPEAEAEADVEAEIPEVSADSLGVDEITPEATREMIAKWNVPSWSEIVTGLYRPER